MRNDKTYQFVRQVEDYITKFNDWTGNTSVKLPDHMYFRCTCDHGKVKMIHADQGVTTHNFTYRRYLIAGYWEVSNAISLALSLIPLAARSSRLYLSVLLCVTSAWPCCNTQARAT